MTSSRLLMIHPSTLAVLPTLPAGATRTRHNDAISGKRLTMPCNSDSPWVSAIRDCLASQHAWLSCVPAVHNTVPLVRSYATQCVFWNASVFGSAWRLYNEVSSGHTTNIVNCTDDPVNEAPVPTTSLDACTSCCSRSSSMSRRLFSVAFVTCVDVTFDSSPSLHSLAVSSACLLFGFHSGSWGLHLIPLRDLRFPVISPSNHVGLMRGMIFVEMCHLHAFDHVRRCNTATREKIDSAAYGHVPIVLFPPFFLASRHCYTRPQSGEWSCALRLPRVEGHTIKRQSNAPTLRQSKKEL